MSEPALRLELYVAGDAPNSRRARDHLEAILEAHFSDSPDLELVDVLEHPSRALKAGVLATPTLLIHRGDQVQRLIGDLSDSDLLQSSLVSRKASRWAPGPIP